MFVLFIFGLFPYISVYSFSVVRYEFALLFFSVALLFYFWNFNKKEKNKDLLLLVLSGVFFALAFLARNAFAVSFIPFLAYDLWRNRSWKRFLFLILPFIIIVSGVLISDLYKGYPNGYLGRYLGQEREAIGWDGHCFPDPYTYYFEREEYVGSVKGLAQTDEANHLRKYGYNVSLKNTAWIYLNSVLYYFKNLLRLITFGGPIIITLMIIGLGYLSKKNREMFILFIFWIVFWWLILVIRGSSNFNHFLEIILPLTLLGGLGVVWLANIFSNYFSLNKFRRKILLVFLIFLVFMHLAVANKWAFHEKYNIANQNLFEFVDEIKNEDIKEKEVIASDMQHNHILILNYLANKNFVVFRSETINKLAEENKLQEAFDKFNIKYILGYNKKTNELAKNRTDIKVIEVAN